MADFEKLETMHQLRVSMQILCDQSQPAEKRKKALENLFDAYNAHTEANPKLTQLPVQELRNSLVSSVSISIDSENLPATKEKLKQIQEILSKDSSLNNPELSSAIKTLSQHVESAHQLDKQIHRIEENPPKTDQNRINKLLRTASEITNTAKQQKKTNEKQAQFKQFLEEALTKREKLTTKVNITQVELQNVDGEPKLSLIDDHGQTTIVPIMFVARTKEPLFGRNINTKDDMKPLYAFLKKEHSISFIETQQTSQTKNKQGYTTQNFCQDIKFKLTKAKAPDLAKELEGYNALLTSNPKDAAELMQKLKDKYIALALNQQKAQLIEEKAEAQTNINSSSKIAQQALKQTFSQISKYDLLRLMAPATGQNKDEEKNRQHFSELLSLTCQPKTRSDAYQTMLKALSADEILWKTTNDAYYKQIKECAEDNYFQTLAKQMLEGKNRPKEVLAETSASLSPDLAKKVLARSVITYGMGNFQRQPHPDATNKVLDAFGYQLHLSEMTVEKRRDTTSKETTLIMRCLADGHSLDMSTLSKDDYDNFQKHKNEIQQTFGSDKNYTALVGNVLNQKDPLQSIGQTPYQTHNMKIGLLAALHPEISKQIDFSETIKKSLPEKDQKSWDLDDYLFTRYINLYFNKNISPADKDSIKNLKQGYDWEGFKNQNKAASELIYQDFNRMNKKTQTIVINALTLGKLDEGSKHHQRPLKFSVLSGHPLDFNNTLVTAAQPKPWEEDVHQLHHLSTIEGTNMVPPYCVKTDNGYTRRGQKDLHPGDVVYIESLQVKDKNGKYHDLIPENCFYLSSENNAILEPQPTQKANTFHRLHTSSNSIER